MKNLISRKSLITAFMVCLGLGVSTSSYAVSFQQIYDIPEPGLMALTALGLVGVLASHLHKK